MKPTPIKEHVVRVVNALPPDKLSELLDYAISLQSGKKGKPTRKAKAGIPLVPARRLFEAAGLVDWGGNALKDTERVFG
jgi:hypothetical protein